MVEYEDGTCLVMLSARGGIESFSVSLYWVWMVQRQELV